MTRSRIYSDGEERANTISHAAGIVLGIIAGYVLLSKAVSQHNCWMIGSTTIYIVGMLSSYITSTLYHGCKDETRKRILQKFDHAAIYIHIAGTYTPFTLITLREEGAWGWALFSFVWVAAIVGTYMSFHKSGKHSHIETICYVIMGGSILVAFKPLTEVLSLSNQMGALYWLIAGGASYVIGALFYSLAKKKYMHTVFHFFVLGGSISHIIAIYTIL